MKIINKTSWDSKKIKNLFAVCLKEVKRREGNERHLKNQTVYLKSHNRNHVYGRAYVNSSTLILKLPYPHSKDLDLKKFTWWKVDYDFAQKLADTYIHEVGHNLGIKKHSKGGDTMEHLYQDWIFENISNEKFPIAKVQKIVPKVDIKQKRYHSALTNFAKAQTKFRRVKTLLDKWQRKIKYYETGFAFAAEKEKK